MNGASNYLTKKEFEQLQYLVLKAKSNEYLEEKELQLLNELIIKIQMGKYHKRSKLLSYFAVAILVFIFLYVALMILGFWDERFSTAGTIVAIIMHFSLTVLLLKDRTAYFNSISIGQKLIWYIAFILNMYFFVDGLLDILNIRIAF